MRLQVGVGLLLLACGPSASPAPATPEPVVAEPEVAPEPEAAEAPAEEEGGEWVWEPNDFRTHVNAGRSGPVVGYLMTPESLEGAERRGSSILIRTAFQREGRLPLYVSIWADRTEPFEAPQPQEAVRVASHHRVQLHIDDEAPIELGCDTIEVLEDGDGKTWARVARGGVVIEGWIEGRIEGRGPASCPARVLREGELPPGFVARAAQPPTVPRRGSVWWLSGTEDARSCVEWRWARNGRSLEHRSDGGVTSYGVGRSATQLELTGPGFRGDDGTGMGMGCSHILQLVGGDQGTWVFVPTMTTDISGYHPDDAEVWYRSEAACESAREAEARARQGC